MPATDNYNTNGAFNSTTQFRKISNQIVSFSREDGKQIDKFINTDP